MYRYDEFDHQFVGERTAQFRDQANRRLSGEMSEDEFRPLRLMNGLYLQLHAYMLRVAIPYGTLPTERVVETTIGQLWECVHTQGLSGPTIIYVGLAKSGAAAMASADIVPFPVREDIRDAILRAAS